MTEEESRNVGYLVYVLGHHNWYTFIHKNNFQTYVTYHCPTDMKRASSKVKWVCALSLKEHRMHDCNAKLFTCSQQPSDPEALMDYTLLRNLNPDLENQLAVLKFFELVDTLYRVTNGQTETVKITPYLLDLCCSAQYATTVCRGAKRSACSF